VNPEILQSAWTVVSFLVFVGIVTWAWSRGAQRGFAEAERLPLEDDSLVEENGRNAHG
jgi:cytochrome c oxidase cbb3-type subunit 4